MAHERRLGSYSAGGIEGLRWRYRHDRQFLCPGAPARCHRKKGDVDDGCMGRSRGGLTTKIHAVVDAEGRPVELTLTAGQTHDSKMAEPMLGSIGRGTTLLADRAYDTDALRALAKAKGAWANIPAKRNRKATFSFSRGSIANAIWLSVSSTNSNNLEPSLHVTTKIRLTSSQPSNSPQHASGSMRYESTP